MTYVVHKKGFKIDCVRATKQDDTTSKLTISLIYQANCVSRIKSAIIHTMAKSGTGKDNRRRLDRIPIADGVYRGESTRNRDWGDGTSIGVTVPQEWQRAENKPGGSKPRRQEKTLDELIEERKRRAAKEVEK